MIEQRFRVTIGNENDVRLVDYSDNKQLINISFKDYKDAVDCRDALLYQCNMMNELNNENTQLLIDNKELKCTNITLFQENKELKNEITLLDMELTDKEKAFEKLHNMYVEAIKENKELKSKIKQLETENKAQSDAIDGLQGFITHFDLEELDF